MKWAELPSDPPSGRALHPTWFSCERAVGATACRLGVPDACGFLWEEVAARQNSSEAWAGEIPPPPLVARYLNFYRSLLLGIP